MIDSALFTEHVWTMGSREQLGDTRSNGIVIRNIFLLSALLIWPGDGDSCRSGVVDFESRLISSHASSILVFAAVLAAHSMARCMEWQ
jgi:hypothetical protein